jgi:hypothetical protein
MNFDNGCAFPGYTLRELCGWIETGRRTDPAVMGEIKRRLRVENGEIDAMTPGERLMRANFFRTVFVQYKREGK